MPVQETKEIQAERNPHCNHTCLMCALTSELKSALAGEVLTHIGNAFQGLPNGHARTVTNGHVRLLKASAKVPKKRKAPPGLGSSYKTLEPDRKARILELHKAGRTRTQIAKEVKASYYTVTNVLAEVSQA